MSALLGLLDVTPTGDGWLGAASGPAGKRAYGGQLTGQSLAAACRTVEPHEQPTGVHVQFLRGGDAGEPVEYRVENVYDGRTSASRRVESRQAGRLLTTATVSFAASLAGPEHGSAGMLPGDPEALERTGPVGPAPSLPLQELDIRVADDVSDGFLRRMWWRVTVDLPADALLHTIATAYICDLYMIDPALAVHGHSMRARTHRSGTTDSSIWFHRRIRADEWNLLELRSPAAAGGRAVVTGQLTGADGAVTATLVQQGLIAEREQPAT